MSDSPKIHIDDVHVGIRPEEIDSILGLRNTFDYFEVLGNYVSSYLELGWVVKLVIPHLDIALDLDFRQVREVWNQGLTDLAVKGIHTCLMVYTGTASNLMVLEVHGRNAEKALALGRDWRAQCVIQVGDEREQHFFTWPQSLTLPNQASLETLDIQVFGEGGKVTLPPSLVPGVESRIRWLVPPWENSPTAPAPRLMEFLRGQFPGAAGENRQLDPDIPAWEEIFAHIASQARLMQTLLTPMTESEEYYRNLLQEARASGLHDQRLLLGLLWHAPLGRARHEPNNLQWFKDLIKGNDQDGISDPSHMQKQLADLIQELSKTLTDLNKERENSLKDSFKTSHSFSPAPDNFSLGNMPLPTYLKDINPKPGPELPPPESLRSRDQTERPTMCFIHPSVSPQGDIPVNRKQYEAMIYELGRLGALQKFSNRITREANSLKSKIEAQRQEEVNHLRQLVQEKNKKKWW
jgi:hypothetical protein